MKTLRNATDVAIVGAGTAGAAAATLCAERGLRVLCLEQRPRAEAGARWVNGVPGWCFEQAGIELPRGQELRGAGHAFHLLSGWGPKRVVVRDHGLLEVDMRLLVERLQARAQAAGAEIVEGARVVGFDGERLRTTAGEVTASWFVDASGLSGARLLAQPRVGASDLCSAAQEVREVRDAERARAYFEQRGVRPGETLCFTGVAGGFSVVNLRLDGDAISILTGSIPADGHPSGARLLAELVLSEPWIGQRVFGGARAIPLRRPFDRLGRGRVLLLGDAACQVFSAHGSGIGAGMLAARVLAETLAAGGDAHEYAARWHRRHGGLFAGYEIFRRLSQSFAPRDIERLMDSGVLDDNGARAGLAQRFPELDRRALAAKLSALPALGRQPRLARRLAEALARIAVAQAHWARYPRRPARLPAWSRRAARIVGSVADALE